MRVYVYEENEGVVEELCKRFSTTPTKLTNELLLYLEQTVRHEDKAKDKHDLLRRFDRGSERSN